MPTLASHRGFGKYAAIPENTIPAFLASEKLGFHAHELDVRRTSDGEVVLLHGPRLENTTNGTGRIEDVTYEYIKTLNAAAYLKNSNYAAIPTLDELLTALPKTSRINIEIKRDRWDFSRGLEEESVRIAGRHEPGRIFFSGFHFLTVWRLRRTQTKIPVGLLIEPGLFARVKLFIYRLILRPDNIHLHHSTATPGLMARLTRKGYGLMFWTVNDVEKAGWLFQNGADVVITDNMEMIKGYRAPR